MSTSEFESTQPENGSDDNESDHDDGDYPDDDDESYDEEIHFKNSGCFDIVKRKGGYKRDFTGTLEPGEPDYYEPYAFKAGQKFCLMPPGYHKRAVSDSDFIECIPNETSFDELMICALGHIRRNKDINKELVDYGGHINFYGHFHRGGNVWYYDCDS